MIKLNFDQRRRAERIIDLLEEGGESSVRDFVYQYIKEQDKARELFQKIFNYWNTERSTYE